MKFQIITIFPQIFDSYFSESIVGRAQKNKLVNIKTHDLRKWANNKHNKVDDTPFGGGAGMVMKVEPIYSALNEIQKKSASAPSSAKATAGKKATARRRKIVLLSAKGKKWNQQMAKKYAKLDEVILICGRYEGVDERVKKFCDEEISIGDYVLTGGEIGAMTIVDSITRLLPGVLGNAQSLANESHNTPGNLEHPQYTRPEVFEAGGKKYRVPKVLLSGNHKKVEEWKIAKSKFKVKK